MAKKKKPRGGLVYSTDPNFSRESDQPEESETLPPQQQDLRLHLDRLKGNKVATRIAGFIGSTEDLKGLEKTLKSHCGVGGSAKSGLIILQGDVRTKVETKLTDLGYRFKRSGG